MVTEKHCCCVPSWLLGNTFPRWSSIFLAFSIRSVINHPWSAFNEDCKSVRVRAYEVSKIAISLLSPRNSAIQWVLKAGTWLSKSTFSAFYLRDHLPQTHGYLFHWSCGGTSSSHVAHKLFRPQCSNSHPGHSWWPHVQCMMLIFHSYFSVFRPKRVTEALRLW